MLIVDKIETKGLFLIEQDLPRVTFYEVYCHGAKLFHGKDFNEAVSFWSNLVAKV